MGRYNYSQRIHKHLSRKLQDAAGKERATMGVVKRLLKRQKSTARRLSEVERDDQDRLELEELWASLESPILNILADYPTHEGEYEQRESGVRCKYVTGQSLWLCDDEMDGLYLMSDEDARNLVMMAERE